jgi:hypothetical protein
VLSPVIAARRRRRLALRALATLACAALPLATACGKKGPPLAPLARLPVAPAQVSASRAANTVTIRFTVPGANVSGIRPADIERVDVYAWTGPDAPAARVFKVAKVVASVQVRPPPPPPDPDADGNVPPPPPPAGPGVDQGAATELRETLAADAFLPVDVTDPKKKARAPGGEPKVTPPDAMPLPPPLSRRYIVVGVNRGGQRGRAAPGVAVPLWTPPPPPPAVTAKALQSGTELSWTAPPVLRRPVLVNALPDKERAPAPTRTAPAPPVTDPDDDDDLPDDGEAVPDEDEDETPGMDASPDGAAEPAAPAGERPARTEQPTAAPRARQEAMSTAQPAAAGDRVGGEKGLLPARLPVPWPAMSIGFHVYEVPSQQIQAPASTEAGGPPPALPRRLTTAPLKPTTFTDTRVEYGVERCYVVRTAETMGTLTVESEASAPTCVKAADVFPPAAPKSLAAVSSAGAISLIWEGSDAPDLAGYIVLRGTAPGEPVDRLTPQPVRETTFRDTAVKPGTRYVYAVVAVDTATPPNTSAPSNRIEETAR